MFAWCLDCLRFTLCCQLIANGQLSFSGAQRPRTAGHRPADRQSRQKRDSKAAIEHYNRQRDFCILSNGVEIVRVHYPHHQILHFQTAVVLTSWQYLNTIKSVKDEVASALSNMIFRLRLLVCN